MASTLRLLIDIRALASPDYSTAEKAASLLVSLTVGTTLLFYVAQDVKETTQGTTQANFEGRMFHLYKRTIVREVVAAAVAATLLHGIRKALN